MLNNLPAFSHVRADEVRIGTPACLAFLDPSRRPNNDGARGLKALESARPDLAGTLPDLPGVSGWAGLGV